MLLMLCEALELEGIQIISANTDGIMVKVYEDQEDKFNEISDWWRNKTKMKADSDVVHCLIARDVEIICVVTLLIAGKLSLINVRYANQQPS